MSIKYTRTFFCINCKCHRRFPQFWSIITFIYICSLCYSNSCRRI
nr:MAG TPA: hypothetical protein [Caudoviricetes sp.]